MTVFVVSTVVVALPVVAVVVLDRAVSLKAGCDDSIVGIIGEGMCDEV